MSGVSVGCEFLHDEVDGLGHVRDVDLGEVAKSLEIRGARERVGDDGSASGLDVDAEAKGVIAAR